MRRARWSRYTAALAALLGLGLLLGPATAGALTCRRTSLDDRVKGAAAVVFGEVVEVKGRKGLIRIDAVLKGKELLEGVEKLRWHRYSRYAYLPPRGTLVLLFLRKAELGKPDAKKIAETIKPGFCNTLSVLRRAK